MTVPNPKRNGSTYLHRSLFRAPVGTPGANQHPVDFDTFVIMRIVKEYEREQRLQTAIENEAINADLEKKMLLRTLNKLQVNLEGAMSCVGS